jgi:predicted  nucleic acid-binding Zn-ribbon protein
MTDMYDSPFFNTQEEESRALGEELVSMPEKIEQLQYEILGRDERIAALEACIERLTRQLKEADEAWCAIRQENVRLRERLKMEANYHEEVNPHRRAAILALLELDNG